MRLIDADAIYSEMKDYYFTHRDEHDASWEGGFGKCMNMILKAPTIEPQEESEAREYLEYGKLIAKGIAQGLRGDSNEP